MSSRFLILLLLLSNPVLADGFPDIGKFYPDGHGGAVYFPLGDVSFADQAVDQQLGDPAPSNEKDRNPLSAIGIPDFDQSTDRGYLTLGCGGSVTLRFSDNALVDAPGPDLYVFEIGDAIEPTLLSISANGTDWMAVGRISGGRAAVDIAEHTTRGDTFRFVRLTDLKSDCGPGTPGADIDAVGAIGSGLRITLRSDVLFGFAEHDLKPEAQEALGRVREQIRGQAGAQILVHGHTDDIGSNSSNFELSVRRARTVARVLIESGATSPGRIEIHGFGESRPVADNQTDDGRQRNRRVELVIVPTRISQTGSELEGLWETSQGQMVVARRGSRIFARYANDNGRCLLELEGRTLKGYWIEDHASQECDSTKDGSSHWGRIQLTFDESFERFEGTWTYCDSDASQGEWSGRRLRQ